MMPPLLPPLTGSPKQIAWANDLRDKVLAESDVALDDPLVVPLLAEKTDASYWIGNTVRMSWHLVGRRGAAAYVHVPMDRGPRVTEDERWTETWGARVEDSTLVTDEWEGVYKRDDDLHVVVEWSRPRFGSRGRPTKYSVTVSRDGNHIGSRHFAENVWWGQGSPEGFVRQILDGSPPHWA
jgi:hypothetical protein